MNYGDLIRDAFRITLHNRFLWFFGFFAGGTGSNFLGNVPSGGGNLEPRRLLALGRRFLRAHGPGRAGT